MSIRRVFSPQFTMALVLLLLAAGGLNAAVARLGLYLQKLPIQPEGDRQVRAMPKETENWKQVGQDAVMSKEMQETLETTNYLSRLYQQKNIGTGPPITLQLHLAYYTGMIDTVPHVPERCMVGGGYLLAGRASVLPLDLDPSAWSPHPSPPPDVGGQKRTWMRVRHSNDDRYSAFPGQYTTLPLGIDKGTMRVSRFKGPDDSLQFAGYFFVTNGGVCSSANDIRLMAFRLTDNYAYYLKIQVSSQDVKSEEELVTAARSLIGELLPDILRCVPDWVEVEKGTFPPDNPARRTRDERSSAASPVWQSPVQTTPENADPIGRPAAMNAPAFRVRTAL